MANFSLSRKDTIRAKMLEKYQEKNKNKTQYNKKRSAQEKAL